MKIKFCYLLLLFIPMIAFAQELRIVKGNLTKDIAVPGAPGENFVLYTPSNYNQNQKWPVIFIFDPYGRAGNTANLFRTAAEEQGYLIAALEMNIKEKSIDSVITTASSMINMVKSSLSIDGNQVYTAGMGEGAQIGAALTLLEHKMAGILAIGNSFLNPELLDSRQPYMFIGIGGRQDYMVYEMEEYFKFYKKQDYPTEIYYFDGRENEWPSSATIYNAVSGFTMQAMKSSVRAMDEALISKIYQHEIDYVETQRRLRKYYSAYQNLERMEEKYQGTGFEDAIKDRSKELKKEREFSMQKRNFRDAVAYERNQQEEYVYLLNSDILTQNFQNIGWWAYQMDGLEELTRSNDKAKVDMAYRLAGYLDLITKKQYNEIVKSSAPVDVKVFISVLRTAINKDDPDAYFKIISLAAMDGDSETAMLYLEDLLKTGYKDYESLYSIDGTLGLKFSKDYNAIIQKYLSKSKY